MRDRGNSETASALLSIAPDRVSRRCTNTQDPVNCNERRRHTSNRSCPWTHGRHSENRCQERHNRRDLKNESNSLALTSLPAVHEASSPTARPSSISRYTSLSPNRCLIVQRRPVLLERKSLTSMTKIMKGKSSRMTYQLVHRAGSCMMNPSLHRLLSKARTDRDLATPNLYSGQRIQQTHRIWWRHCLAYERTTEDAVASSTQHSGIRVTIVRLMRLVPPLA